MGHPSEKSAPTCTKKSMLVAVAAILFSVAITAIITYNLTRIRFDADRKDDDKSTKKPADEVSAADLRLPTSVEPISYDLIIKTYIPGYGGSDTSKALTFDGQINIKLAVKSTVRKISLNSLDLNFTTTKCILTTKGESIAIQSIDANPKFEKVFINLAKPLEANSEAELKLVYTGPIRSDLNGLYHTEYKEKDGTEKVAVTTQMEPTYARKMVPCFDEPAYKANWTVTVIHPKGTTAVSNGKELSETILENGFKSTKFATTPRMSSYLLAILVSEFQYLEKNTKNGVRFRVYARPEFKEMTRYALDAGVKCLEYYEDYYGIKFPLPKQDMIALPDFAAGAMENWGMITYRETAVLYDEKIYLPGSKQRVAVVIAHELAHQWFGDLVTMQWWDDLWLNEGFATYVEYMGTDVISDGHFRMAETFTKDSMSNALAYDSKSITHPLSFKIDKSVEVEEAFDTISYDKGGSVLQMIRKVMGEKNFQAGLQLYLNKHAYGNAKAADLFKALNEKTPDSVLGTDGKKLDVVLFSEQWTTQLGYPMLTTKRVNTTHVKVSQERFKLSKTAKEQEKYLQPKYGFKWDVPVWYQTADGKKGFTWLKKEEDLYLEAGSPVVLNVDSEGYYRVNYDEDEWRKIADVLMKDHNVFSTRTRARLIQDAFRAAQLEMISYDTAVNLIKYLKNEKEYVPWTAAHSEFNTFFEYYGTDPEVEPIKKYRRKLMAKVSEKASFTSLANNYKDDKQFFEMLEMSRSLGVQCSDEEISCVGNVTQMFQKDVNAKCGPTDPLSTCSKLAAPLRPIAYCYGVKHGDERTFDKVLSWHRAEPQNKEREYLLSGMSCSKDAGQLKKLLLNALDEKNSDFRLQDVYQVFGSVFSNEVALSFGLNFLTTRWDEILPRFDKERAGLRRSIVNMSRGITSRAEIEQLKAFCAATPSTNDYANSFKTAFETAETRVAWREKNLKKISVLFAKLLNS